MCSGRQSRPHLFHVVRKVCTKSGHVSTIPPVVKNNSHHGISTIKSDYPLFLLIKLPNALSSLFGDVSFRVGLDDFLQGCLSSINAAAGGL